MPDPSPRIASEAAGGNPTLAELALLGLSRLVPASAAELEEFAVLRHAGPPLAARRADAAIELNRARPAEAERTLVRLGGALGLSAAELLLCALALRVETDVRLERALARLQGSTAALGPVRPTLGLVARWLGALGLSAHDGAILAALVEGHALRSGLLRLAREESPLAERTVALHAGLLAPLLRAPLRGREPARTEFGSALARPLQAAAWSLPESWLEALQGFAAALKTTEGSFLVVRTRVPLEGRAVAARLAAAMQRLPVELCGVVCTLAPSETTWHADLPPGVEPWLLAEGALPVIVAEPGPSDLVRLPRFAYYRGPVVVAAGLEGSFEAGDQPRLVWSAPMPTIKERAALWRGALGAKRAGAELAEELAQEIRCGVGNLHAMAAAALQRALQRGSDARVEKADVLAELSSGALDQGLSALSRRLPAVAREALVAPAALAHELELTVARCRARERLIDGLGLTLQARYSPGLKFLFVGASGTGKTLAAQWLAGQLGKPLYRVDIAAVSSKYIGETEKNLAQLLARAEQTDCILLFDEADSLFGQRTEVHQANDRFANAQTNYLLERIESFESVAILTSNSKARFDDGFMRRLDSVVEFPLPAATDRRDLWRAHLGAGHALDNAELNQLAAEVELAGGHIRNVVLTAALLARERAAGGSIKRQDIHAALAFEYAKLGRHRPDGWAGDFDPGTRSG